MYNVKEIFDAIDSAIELEEQWRERDEDEKDFIYVVFIWSNVLEIAEWRTFSTKRNSTIFIGEIIRSLYPNDRDCQYYIAINPLGYEDDENNLKKLIFILKMLRKDGIVFSNNIDLDGEKNGA
jgi:hypothetical protein